MDSVRSILSTVVAPIQLVVDFPTQLWGWANRMTADYEVLHQENRELKSQALILQRELQKMAALTAENIRLSELLNGQARVDEAVTVAEVIGVDPDPFTHEVVINKGENDGVFVGQPVLDAYGVMGQISAVGPYTSRALLITDARHAIPVEINRTGARTIAAGGGLYEQLELLYLPDTEDVKEGDMLVTSGLGGKFPQGYPVAMVEQVRHSPGQKFAKVLALPTAQLARSRQILLVEMPRDDKQPATGEVEP